jgi:hypothetical protein
MCVWCRRPGLGVHLVALVPAWAAVADLAPADTAARPVNVCVCLLLQYLIQSCARRGRRIVEDMCYEIRRAEACVD